MKLELIFSNKPRRKGEVFIIDRDTNTFFFKVYKEVPNNIKLAQKIIEALNPKVQPTFKVQPTVQECDLCSMSDEALDDFANELLPEEEV